VLSSSLNKRPIFCITYRVQVACGASIYKQPEVSSSEPDERLRFLRKTNRPKINRN